jgi:hypothetical protein
MQAAASNMPKGVGVYDRPAARSTGSFVRYGVTLLALLLTAYLIYHFTR